MFQSVEVGVVPEELLVENFYDGAIQLKGPEGAPLLALLVAPVVRGRVDEGPRGEAIVKAPNAAPHGGARIHKHAHTHTHGAGERGEKITPRRASKDGLEGGRSNGSGASKGTGASKGSGL